jgi:predicted MFS family arabinose efflux permease
MLAHASAVVGVGKTFGLHEALDQTGALAGPLLIAAVLALGGSYKLAFALLAVPGVVALLVLGRLRAAAPDPSDYDPAAQVSDSKKLRLDTRLPARFWLYSGFSALTMLGFATWAVLAYHLVHRHVLSSTTVPILYAAAMGAAALASLAVGRLYDRAGFRGLVVIPLLAAGVPVLSFSTSIPAVVAGAVVWGAGMGVHDSTMRAAVTDLVPRARRGAGYGTFTAIYGVAWLVGAAMIGALYDVSVTAIEVVVIAVQAAALVALVPLLRSDRRARELTDPAAGAGQ